MSIPSNEARSSIGYSKSSIKPILPPLSLKSSPATKTSSSQTDSSKLSGSLSRRPPVPPSVDSGSHLAPLPHINSTINNGPEVKKFQNLSPRYASSESSASSAASSGRPYRSYPSQEGPKADHPYSGNRDEAGLEALVKKPFFENSELEKYDLPLWEILDKLLDYYYTHNHINHQILTKREIFLSRISLKNDSPVLHAIIATVCLDNQQYVRPDEEYWMDRAYKYWDDLNDFGMLLCYSLFAKTFHLKYNQKKFIEASIKIYEIISYNRYLEIFHNNLKLNSRQTYERELVVRMIWNYWAHHLVIFRFNQGYPYFKLSMTNNEQDFKLNFEIDNYYDKLMLPLNNEDHLQLENLENRITWKNLSDISQVKFDDAGSVVYAVKLLENVMNNISKNDLTADISKVDLDITKEFFHYIESNLFINKNEEYESGTMIINSGTLLSNFVAKLAIIIQNSCIFKNILIFKPYLYNFTNSKQQATNSRIELFNDISMNDIINLEELPKSLNLQQNEWKSLLELYKNALDIVRLIEIGEGKLPNGTDSYSIAIGVTETSITSHYPNNKQQWWKDKSLTTKGKETWIKFPKFSLEVACCLISVLPSLIVLTKFVKLAKKDEDLEITIVCKPGDNPDSAINKTVIIPNYSYLDQDLIKLFELEDLLNRFSKVVNFIQFKLQMGNNNELLTETVSRMNKRSHYLEEILNNIK